MSTLKVDDIQSRQSTDDAISLASDSSVSLKHSASAKLTTTSTGVSVTGTCAATTFSGSGASLTSIPAANITGTLPALSAANLTSIPAANITGTLPAIDGSNLTGVGGGGFEFVSKSEVSGTSVAYIDFTNLSNDSMYRLVGKQVIVSSYSYERYEFLDTSGNPISGKLNYTRILGTTSISTNGWTSQNAFYGAGVSDASSSKGASILEFFTKPGQVWFRFDGTTLNGTRAFMQTWGNFESSDTTTQIGGVRIRDDNTNYDIQVGTQILLYKYKES